MGFDVDGRPDFLIVGAGVIGCAIARELVLREAGSVVVIDRATPGAESSGAAAGVLAVTSSRARRGAVLRLKRASAALYPVLCADLLGETRIDVEYCDAGLLELGFDDRDADQLAAVVRRRVADGEPAEWLDAAAVRSREAGVSDDVRCGAYFAGDHALNSSRLVEALRVSAENHGARFLLNSPVREIERDGTRLLGIRAADRWFSPGELIVAAGLGSRQIGSLLRAKMPIRPDRGEMLALRPRRLPACTTVWREGYLVPRNNGELLIGSTSARGEVEKTVRAGSVELLLRRAMRMVPDLGEAPIVRKWAGIRPMCTLRRPMIGPVAGYENVTVATGHHRSGILLAPITARLVAESILDSETSIPLAPFKYRKKP